jgi:hypothetical protein
MRFRNNPTDLSEWKKLNTVFACYDGKISRATEVRVISVTKRQITIAGHLWGEGDSDSECYYTLPRDYRQGYQVCEYAGYLRYPGKMLMEILGIGPGDWYRIYTDINY